MLHYLGFVHSNHGHDFEKLRWLWDSLQESVTMNGKVSHIWLESLMSEEAKLRVSPSNLSGNRSVNIAPVSSLLRLQCGSKAVCRMDGSCLAARVNTLPFCCIPWIHYTASQHTGRAVRSYQFHYTLNPLTAVLTCWIRLILILRGCCGLSAQDGLIQTTKYLKRTFDNQIPLNYPLANKVISALQPW